MREILSLKIVTIKIICWFPIFQASLAVSYRRAWRPINWLWTRMRRPCARLLDWRNRAISSPCRRTRTMTAHSRPPDGRWNVRWVILPWYEGQTPDLRYPNPPNPQSQSMGSRRRLRLSCPRFLDLNGGWGDELQCLWHAPRLPRQDIPGHACRSP